MRSSRGRSPGSRPACVLFFARAKIRLELCSFSGYQCEHCSNNPEATQMKPLIFQTMTTFVGDAFALVNGFGRTVTHLVMAPVERIAKASDVAGILPERS